MPLRLSMLCLPLWWLPVLSVLVLSAPVSAQMQVSEPSDFVSDVRYRQARQLIADKRYREALSRLRELRRDVPDFHDRPALDARIAVLHEAAEAGTSLSVFIDALDLRDSGETLAAIDRLQDLLRRWPGGALQDDALYLIAYLQLMDRYDYTAARQALRRLFSEVPDSAYGDSALYLDAIALEQVGETEAARVRFESLLDRHTALRLPFGFRWPVGTVLSRYWFERTERRLALLVEQADSASSIDHIEEDDRGTLTLTVNVGGIDMTLDLQASSLTYSTAWRDHLLQDLRPPAVGIYAGRVEGEAKSWARVVINGEAISGMVEVDGQRYRLQPGNLVGTLDYYQPRRRAPLADVGTLSLGGLDPYGNPLGSRSGNAVENPYSANDRAGTIRTDALRAPRRAGPRELQRRARGTLTDVRLVPLSLLVDTQFDRYYAGTGLAKALEHLNVADGIYRQFGLALAVDEAVVVSAGTADPLALGPVTLETSLRTFRDFRLANRTLFGDSALTYLFTGNPRTDVTLGLAWIDTLCRVDGFDVGVTTPNVLGDLLLTHELGHSLGAKHDSDTECKADTDKLMWPEISSRTSLVFSECSHRQLADARRQACLLDAVDLSVAMWSTGDVLAFELTNPDSQRQVAVSLDIESSVLGMLHWPEECRTTTPGSAECSPGMLAPGETRTWELPLRSKAATAAFSVTAHLRPVEIVEVNKADNVARVDIERGGATLQTLPGSNELALLEQPAKFTESGETRGDTGAGMPDTAGGSEGWWWLAMGGWAVLARRIR